MAKGLFIVLEGGDAAGKHTQSELLCKRALKEGFKAAKTAFPRYDTPQGEEIRRYLDGNYGGLDQVDARFASMLYILDRAAAQRWIEDTLHDVDLLVADRYSSANFAHQGAKFKSWARKGFIDWLMRFEHGGQPLRHIMPDRIIYLDLPVEIAQEAMKQRGHGMDIHEADTPYQQRVRETFLELAKSDKRWEKIDCINASGGRRTREELSDIIWGIVHQMLLNPSLS